MLLTINLEGTQVEVCSELAILEEHLILFKFFRKDASINALVVHVLACDDDCLKLGEALSFEHLIAKLREFLHSLLTELCLKMQEVHNAEVVEVFDNPV